MPAATTDCLDNDPTIDHWTYHVVERVTCLFYADVHNRWCLRRDFQPVFVEMNRTQYAL